MSRVHTIDQSTDYSNTELYSFLSGVNLPEFVKEASIEEVTDTTLNKEAYADTVGKLFPINSKARIYVSNAFLSQKRAELIEAKGKVYVDKVEKAITKAAKDFGIFDEVESYNANIKTAANKEYTISCTFADRELELFKVGSADDLAAKAAEFLLDLSNYPFEWRKDIATEFVKAAEYFDLEELPDLIFKYAGHFYPDFGSITNELERRMNKLSAAGKEVYSKLISSVEAGLDPEDYYKVAEVCYRTEQGEGLYKKAHLRAVLGDPVDKLFPLSIEKVAKMLDVVTVHDKLYSVDALQKVSNTVFEQAFGFEKPASLDELRDVLPTMPRSDMALFEKLSGIKSLN